MRKVKELVVVGVVLAVMQGCATSTVLKRPAVKNLETIKPGVSRGLVLAELNQQPINTSEVSGNKCDSFAFDKGVHGGWKAGRAIFHLGADIFTGFLWELVAWPAEKAVSGPNTKMQVCYDGSEKVRTVEYLKGGPSPEEVSMRGGVRNRGRR